MCISKLIYSSSMAEPEIEQHEFSGSGLEEECDHRVIEELRYMPAISTPQIQSSIIIPLPSASKSSPTHHSSHFISKYLIWKKLISA